MNQVWTDPIVFAFGSCLKKQHETETKSQCLLPGFYWQIIFLHRSTWFPGELLQIWLSAFYFARGFIFRNSPNLFFFCWLWIFCGEHQLLQNNKPKVCDGVISTTTLTVPSERTSDGRSLLHQVFQMLQVHTDASLSMDKVPVELSLRTGPPQRHSVFSLQVVKLKMWGVVAKCVSEPFDCWCVTSGHQDSDAADR